MKEVKKELRRKTMLAYTLQANDKGEERPKTNL
jgi:hypothetical protein